MGWGVWSIESVRESATATNINPCRRSGELRVLLTKDVDNLGRAGDVKEVADGYGRNFLLRRKLAVPAGKGAETEAKRLQDAAVKRETKDKNEAQAVADDIDNKTVVVRLKVGAEDKAFGSITNQDIASALKAQHRVEIDRHKIDLKEPIKTLGEHQVSLKLHRDVSAHVNVIVTQDR
ncbi:MAG: 50S ribosomal protein L9 [Chloroflexi bacterium]|nr:MAG: 50S ribosomal protein L9 [Chloroflexota bacterium]